jgi:hypothetical protein
MAAAVVQYARNPVRRTQNDILDYTLKKDIDLYTKGTEKLEGDLYDGDRANPPTFLKQFGAKAKQYNWMRILTFGQGATAKNLIKHYGEITKAEVQAAAVTYLGTDYRRDQDSDMMYNCLRKSVSNAVFAKVATEPEHYTYTVQNQADPLEDGPSFLKAIIDHTYTNTLSNTAVAQENLSSLPEYMATLQDSNITEFNDYVKKQLEALAAGGDTTSDLVINLFKGYAKAKDKDFKTWVKQKKGEWFDCTFAINPNGLDLMELTENHYKDAVKTKEWMKLDDDQQLKLALQTKIKAVKATARQQMKRNDPKSKKKGKHRDKKQPGTSEWAWKKQELKQGESHIKNYSGKTYHWCPYHELWSLHKKDECLLKEEKEKQKKKKSNKLKMKVYQAAMEDTSEEEEQEEASYTDEDSSSEDSESS